MTRNEYKEKYANNESISYTYENAPEKAKRAYDKFFLLCVKKYLKNPNQFEYSVAAERITLFMNLWDYDFLIHLLIRDGVFRSPVPPKDFYIPVEELQKWMEENLTDKVQKTR